MNTVKFKNFIDGFSAQLGSLEDISVENIRLIADSLKTTFSDFRKGGEELIKEGETLKIGVVGQVKAGKSSFLNSLLFDGDSVLPKASTPMTAGLTVLQFAEENSFEVDYYTREEWQEFVNLDQAYREIEKTIRADKAMEGAPESVIFNAVRNKANDLIRSAHELVERCGAEAKGKIGKASESVPFSSTRNLQKELNLYVGADGKYTSVVKSLVINLNDPRLKGMRIVDTPGVNDPIVSRENRTREFLHSCHGVFMLSYASRFFDSTDVSFFNTRIGSQGVGTVLLLASKYDDVLQDQGQKFKDDIQGADEASVKSLKSRFEKQRAELTAQSLDIQFDTTSGLCYSLAKKPREQWDTIENHVASRLAELFPSAFTPAEAQDTYLLLANMATIREDYLENMFRKNKDAIILCKNEEYYRQNISEIERLTNSLAEGLTQRVNELNNVEAKDILEQKKHQEELFSTLRDQLQGFIHRFNMSIQTKQKELNEMIDRPECYSLPLEDATVNVTCQGRFWGTNDYDYTVKLPDTNTLKSQLFGQIDEYAKSWREGWRKCFDEARKKLANEFLDCITEAANSDTSLSFSDKYYRNLLDNVLADIDRNAVLGLKSQVEKSKKQVTDMCDSPENRKSSRNYSDTPESGVTSRLDADVSQVQKNLKMNVRNQLDTLVKEVTREVDKCVQSTIDKMKELSNEIETRLKTAGKDYLDKLEKDLANKEQLEKELKASIGKVEKMQSLILTTE